MGSYKDTYLSTKALEGRIGMAVRIKHNLLEHDKSPELPSHLKAEEEFCVKELAERRKIIKL